MAGGLEARLVIAYLAEGAFDCRVFAGPVGGLRRWSD
jgi:hypothetical protein